MWFPTLTLLLLVQSAVWAERAFPVPRVEDVIQLPNDGLSYRLPNNTVPESYDISFTTRIDIEDYTFSGVVRIGILTKEVTSSVTLHHRLMTIVSAQLMTIDTVPQNIPVGAPTYVLETELLTIPISAQLPANTRYTLIITYTSTLRDNNRGLYRSSYLTNDGQRR